MKEALKAAIKAMGNSNSISYEMMHAIADCKEALAQPAQEPVAWGVFEGNLHDMFFIKAEAVEMAHLKGSHAEVRPLYTTPPKRPWVGLTDEEIEEAYAKPTLRKMYQDIEDKLKELNT